jgi:hypothetical protein
VIIVYGEKMKKHLCQSRVRLLRPVFIYVEM